MAKKLLADGTYSQVVIVASGIGGVTAEMINGDVGTNPEVHSIVKSSLDTISKEYSITDFLYHQGEANKDSSEADYVASLNKLVAWVKPYSASARFFISIASVCRSEPFIQVQDAQRAIVNNSDIFQGPNTDDLVPLEGRYDGCHFGKDAQTIVGETWADKLK
jgi:hypothetical protein